MEITALPRYLQQTLNPPVFRNQRRELGKHRLAIHPTKRAPELTTGDCLFGAGAIGDIGVSNTETGHPVTLCVKHRGPGNAPDLEDGFQGFAQDQFIAFGQRLTHRPADRSRHQFQVFTKAIVQSALYRPHANVDSNATEQQQRHYNTEHQR